MLQHTFVSYKRYKKKKKIETHKEIKECELAQ